MQGRELGLQPMQSLRGINVIKGKPTVAADLMGALVQSHPSGVCEYLLLTESSATRASYETRRKGAPRPVTMSYTMEQARTAGNAGKDNYKLHAEAMLRARALSAICRAVYQDIVYGLYVTGEIPAENDEATYVDADVTPTAPRHDSLAGIVDSAKAAAASEIEAAIVDAKRPNRSAEITDANGGAAAVGTAAGDPTALEAAHAESLLASRKVRANTVAAPPVSTAAEQRATLVETRKKSGLPTLSEGLARNLGEREQSPPPPTARDDLTLDEAAAHLANAIGPEEFTVFLRANGAERGRLLFGLSSFRATTLKETMIARLKSIASRQSQEKKA
jgi:hypothetical protein